MPVVNKHTLKNFFKKGSFPTEVHFASLIDSTINKIDDGFAKDINDGLQISPQGTSDKLISFYKNIRDKNPAWHVALNPDAKSKGLSIGEVRGASRLFIQEGGNVGIGTTSPKHKLEVDGFVGMKGRKGTFKQGEVPANGKWHILLEGLNHSQAFEVIAQINGKKGSGKYALTHAICLSTYGRSRNKIRQTRAYYGWFVNRINLRWRGTINNYRLEMRTWSHYGLTEEGLPHMIRYNIAQLWDDGTTQTL